MKRLKWKAGKASNKINNEDEIASFLAMTNL